MIHSRINWRKSAIEEVQTRRGIVVMAPITRIIPEPEGGWLVVTPRGNGWLHGSRREALAEKRSLDDQWRWVRQ
jgi:hypothetical protein